MMSKTDKARLGVFLTVAAILLIGVLVAFAGLKLWDSSDHYFIYSTESVAGLNVGSQVRLRGVSVGTISAMRINPKNVEEIEIDIALKPKTPIMSNTRAVLTSQGMTGLKYIDLKFGTKDAKRLKPKSTIPAEPGLIAKLSNRADGLSKRTDDIVADVAKIVSGENRQRIERILDQSEKLVTNSNMLVVEMTKTLVVTREFIQKNEKPLSITIQNASVASRELPSIMREGRGVIAVARTKVDGVDVVPLLNGLVQTNQLVQAKINALDLNRIFTTLNTLQTLVVKLIGTMSQNQEQVRAMLYNLRRTTDNLKDLSRALKDKPSRLVFEDKPAPRKLP